MNIWFARRSHLLLVGILVVGLALRLWQIGYGLPRIIFTDEEFFTAPATRIADGSLNPGWFGAPASPQIYVIGFTWRAENIVLNLMHHTHTPASRTMVDHPAAFLIVARLWSVLLGVIGVWLLYLIGRQESERVALWAAGFGALNWYLIEQSHIIRPDIWQTTFLLAALWTAGRVLAAPAQKKWFVWLAIWLGLAISEKFTSAIALLGLIPLLWVLWRRGQLRWSLVWLAVGVGAAAVLLTAPFLLLDLHRSIHDLGFEILQPHNIHSDRGFFGNLQLYLQSLDWEVGTLLSLIGLGAFGLARKKKLLTGAAGAAFCLALIYLLVLSLTRQAWDRWMIPVTTLLSLPLAVGWSWLLEQKRRALVLILLVLSLAGPALRCTRLLASFQLPYSSELVRAWFLDHTPPTTTIVSDPYGPKLPDTYHMTSVGTIGGTSPATWRTQGTQYVVATQDILTALQGMAKRYQGSSSYKNAATGYTKIAAVFPLVYSTLPPSGQTTETTLWANDFFIWNTLALDVPRGSVYAVYQVR